MSNVVLWTRVYLGLSRRKFSRGLGLEWGRPSVWISWTLPGRKDTRAGSYGRQLHTKAGEVTLQVPKLRRLPFETAIIERYRRRETSVEEALIEMYLAGVSVRRVEDITQAL